jgi:hypothetical protein
MSDSIPDSSLPINHAALADTARSLARTLQNAPASETPRAARFRKALSRAATTIAARLDAEREANQDYLYALQYIQSVSIPLTSAPPVVPTGIAVITNTFLSNWFPEAQIFLVPDSHRVVYIMTYMAQFVKPFLQVGDPDPEAFYLLHYPQGRQNDTMQLGPLLAESLVDILYGDQNPVARQSYPLLLAEIFGPAIFFSLAEEAFEQEFRDGQKYELYCVYHALKTLGWDIHPQVGPLLESRFADLSQVYTWASHPDAKGESEALWPPPDFTDCKPPSQISHLPRFTPADFDRDVPRLWERLRQLLPPNDLDMGAVESAHPADPISILNAGWSFYLLHMDDLYRVLGAQTPEDRYEAKQVLNRLLTKGIELSQIARRWREARETRR